jgi:hypothetical protein
VQLLVAGSAVRLEAATSVQLDDLRAALGEGPAVAGAAQFVLRSESGSVPMPDRRPDRVVQHVRYWNEGADQIVAVGPGLTALVSAGLAVLDPGTGGERAVHGLLLPVLTSLFAQRGGCLVHGAGFLAGDGAVLVLGSSGQGKSTLVTAVLSLGLDVLSDDLLVLRLQGDGVSVSGVPIPLALPADQAHHPAVGRAIDGDPRHRRVPANATVLASGTYPARAVLLVEHSELAEGHLRVAEGREVLGRLLTSTLDGLSAGTARGVFPYAAAVSRVPGWHLGHAADPAVRVAAAATRIEHVRPGRALIG